MDKIIFSLPTILGTEVSYINQAIANKKLSGDGYFNEKCKTLLKSQFPNSYIQLTPSCTAALEMAYLLIDLKPGDEVILPSYTFTSTATAITIFGGTPVFVDCDEFLNIDLRLIEKAITERTKAICFVNYAGSSVNLDDLRNMISNTSIFLIEDAAQSIGASYNNNAIGNVADISTFSFHETKNINCGEGGAIVINNPVLKERADVIKDKGTNRQRFLNGQVDKYTWQDKGSSYLLSELNAAFLYPQILELEKITNSRVEKWNFYKSELNFLERQGNIEIQKIPPNVTHNAHIFFILLKTEEIRGKLQNYLKTLGIFAVTHYVPLHSSVAGRRFGRTATSMEKTDGLSRRILRLPLHHSLSLEDQTRVVNVVTQFFTL